MDSWGVTVHVGFVLKRGKHEETEDIGLIMAEVMNLFAKREELTRELQLSSGLKNVEVARFRSTGEKKMEIRMNLKGSKTDYCLWLTFLNSEKLHTIIKNLMEKHKVLLASHELETHIVETATEPLQCGQPALLKHEAKRTVVFNLYTAASHVDIVFPEFEINISMTRSNVDCIFTATLTVDEKWNHYHYRATFPPKYFFGASVIKEEFSKRPLPKTTVTRDTFFCNETSKIIVESVITHCVHIILNSNDDNLYESSQQLYILSTEKILPKKVEILQRTAGSLPEETYSAPCHHLCFLVMLSCFGAFNDVKDVLSGKRIRGILISCEDKSKDMFFKPIHISFHAMLKRLTEAHYGENACMLLMMKHAYPFLDESDYDILMRNFKIFHECEVDGKNVSPIIKLLCERILNQKDEKGKGQNVLNGILKALPVNLLRSCVPVVFEVLKSKKNEHNTSVAEATEKMIVSSTVESFIKVKTFHQLKTSTDFLDIICQKNKFMDAVFTRMKKLCLRYEAQNIEMTGKDFESLAFLCVEVMTSYPEKKKTLLETISEAKHKFSSVLPQLLQSEILKSDVELCKQIIQYWMSKRVYYAKQKTEMIENIYKSLLRSLEMPFVKKSQDCVESLKKMAISFLKEFDIFILLDVAKNDWSDADSETLFVEDVRHVINTPKDKNIWYYGKRLLKHLYDGQPAIIKKREKAELVVSLIDFVCPMENELSPTSTIMEIMKHPEFWKSILFAKGESVPVLKQESATYRKVTTSLQDLPNILQQKRFNLNFITYMVDFNKSKNMLDIMTLTGKVDIGSMLEKGRFDLHNANSEMGLLIKELTNLQKKQPNNLKELVRNNLSDTIYYCRDKVKCLQGGEGMELCKFLRIPIWEVEKEIMKSFSNFRPLLDSQIFWRLCDPILMKSTLNNSDQYERTVVMARECTLPDDTTIRESMAFVKKLCTIMETDVVRRYQDIWNPFMSSSDMLVSEVQKIFKNVNVDEEIQIMKKYTGKHLPQPNETSLKAFCNRHIYKEKVHAMITVLDVFCLDQEKHTKINQAMEAYQKLESNYLEDKEFWSLSRDLEDIYDVAGKIDNNQLSVLTTLRSSRTLIEFLKEVAEEDLRILFDAIDDCSETTINISSISSLIDVKRFLLPLLQIPPDGAVEVFFEKMEKQYKKYGDSNVDKKLEECNASVYGLKDLYNSKANRGQQTVEKVQSVVKTGIFIFTLKKRACCIDVKVMNNVESLSTQGSKTSSNENITVAESQLDQPSKNKEVYYRESELLDLRSRAHLIINTKQKDDCVYHHGENEGVCTVMTFEEKQTLLSLFISLIDKAMRIAQIYSELYNQGHYRYEMFSVRRNREDIDTLLVEIQSDLKEWTDNVTNSRKNNYLMNFIHPDHIPALYKYLFSEGKEGRNDVQAILRYITPNAILVPHYTQPIRDDPHTVLENIATFLVKTIHDQSIEFSSTKFPMDRPDTEQCNIIQPGILCIAKLADRSNKRSVQTMLSLFFVNGKEMPTAKQVVLCTSETTWNEVDLLLQRCKRAHEHYSKAKMFCIVNADELPNVLQTSLLQSIQNLDQDTNFMLAIIFRGGNKQAFLHNFPHHIRFIEPLSDAETEMCMKKALPDVHVFTSAFSGQGKSEHIKQTFLSRKEKKQRLVTLDVNSKLDKEDIIERLKSMNITENTALHIDVGMIDRPEELDLFLFQLIVLRYVSHGRKSYYLQTSMVFIEIANTVNNILEDAMQIIGHFSSTHIKWNDYREFHVSSELNSPVQVVCHYLQSLENNTIDNKDLSFSKDDKSCVQPLGEADCRRILKHFFSMTSEMSFSLVEIFLSVLATQLQKVTVSTFFKAKSIQHILGSQKNVPEVRSSIVTAMLNISREFAMRSVSTYRNVQAKSQKFVSSESSDEDDGAENKSNTLGVIRWEDTKHVVVAFHRGNHTLSILYKKLENEPSHIRCIKQFIEAGNPRDQASLIEKSQSDLENILLNMVSKTQRIDFEHRISSYVLTPDNVLKFVLISLRIQAHVPVVLMGETGCGKTTLITQLAFLSNVELVVFRIHAGTTDRDVISKVSECNKKAMLDLTKEIWLFLDEVNTSEQIGLMAGIMSRHQCRGSLLAPNLLLIAACNPYRQRAENNMVTEGLKDHCNISFDPLSRLVYRVHPLPESIVDYVWDFGTLSSNDESKYIRRMVEDCLEHFKSKELLKTFEELIITSQRFVRKTEEKEYSVSLRDVSRCKKLVIWFLEYYMKKKENILGNDHVLQAIILSASICYFVRFRARDIRMKYLKEISAVLTKQNRLYSEDFIFKIIKKEQENILERMDLPPGTAKNVSLRENVFAMIVCTLNRLPLFVVGKPGCSKSLALQLLKNNLRGLDSKDEFFRQLPHLYYVSYQGSEQSTSDGIEKIFKKAITLQQDNDAKKTNPQTIAKSSQSIRIEGKVRAIVILDEVGLAEKSHANPLKILHGLLESPGQVHSDVAFIGISNWTLDAAKMNRAIHLSRPEMDMDELCTTGCSIHKSMACERLQQEQPWYLIELAKAYHEYVENQKVKNFHGLRDYYSLIKYVSENAQPDMTKANEIDVIKTGILRNFSGMRKEFCIVQKVFDGHLDLGSFENIRITDLIKANLKDVSSRHLLLISNGDPAVGMVERLLKELDREYTILVGSNFPMDKKDDYGYSLLSKVILCMEQGKVLVLKNLDGIYGSLYDMLNQSYTTVGEKKHCRIALGHHSNPLCYVHNEFKCIVIIEEEKIPQSDPPFLNRFEKQIISFNDQLTPSQNKILSQILQDLEDICTVNSAKGDGTLSSLSPILVKESIHTNVASLVLKVAENQYSAKQEDENTRKECLEVLLPMACPEAIFNLQESVLWNRDAFLGKHLTRLYMEMPLHEGLKSFLDERSLNSNNIETTRDSTRSNKNISCNMYAIFTYSNSLVHINDCLTHMSFRIENISTISSERDLENRMKAFWIDSCETFLIIRATTMDDMKSVLLTKIYIETWRKKYMEKAKSPKHVVFITYLQRNEIPSSISTIDFTSNWEFLYMDTLQQPVQVLPMIMEKGVLQVLRDRFAHLEIMLKDVLHWAFLRIHYLEQGLHIARIEKSADIISKLPKLRKAFMQVILEYIENEEEATKDQSKWIKDIVKNKAYISSHHTLTSAIENCLMERMKIPLAMIIYKMEELDSFQTMCDMSESGTIDHWIFLFQKTDFHDISKISKQSGPGCYVLLRSGWEFKIPFFKVFFCRVETMRQSFNRTLVSEHVMESELCNTSDKAATTFEMKYRNSISVQLRELSEIYYETEQIKEDYFHDFCKYVLFSKLENVENRIESIQRVIMLFDDSEGNFMRGNLTKFVIRLHLCYWNHLIQIDALLELVQMAPHVGQNDFSPFFLLCGSEPLTDTESDYSRKEAVARIVRSLCIAAIPNETWSHFNDVNKWYQRANVILCLAHRTGQKVEALDILKFFVEFVDIIKPYRLTNRNMLSIGQYLIEKERHIEDKNVYQQLMSLLELLHSNVTDTSENHVSALVLNQAVAMYLNRCLSANDNSRDRICDFLGEVQQSEKRFSVMTYFGPTLQFYISEDVRSQEDSFDLMLVNRKIDHNSVGKFVIDLSKTLKNSNMGHSIAIFLVDILQKCVYDQDTISTNVIYEIKTVEHFLLGMAGNASTMITAKEEPLLLVTAIGFLKSFLSRVVKCIINQSCGSMCFDNKVLINKLNAVLSYKEETCVAERVLHLYFLRCLEHQEGFCNLKRICGSLTDIRVCQLFRSEQIDVTKSFECESVSIFKEDIVSCVVKAFENLTSSSKIEALVPDNRERKGCLLAHLKNVIFLKDAYDKDVPESVRQNAKSVFKHADEKCTDKLFKKLLGLFSLIKTPDIKLLRVSDCDGNISQMVMSLLHFVCVTYSFAPEDGFWFLCVKNPSQVRETFNEFDVRIKDNIVSPHSCSSNQRIKTLRAKCPVCSETLAMGDDGTSSIHAKSSDMFFSSSGDGTSLAFHLLQFLLKGSLLFSKEMQFVDVQELKNILNCHDTDNMVNFLQSKLECHWKNLCLLLGVGNRNMHYLMKIILKEIREEILEEIPLKPKTNEMEKWRHNLSACLCQVLKNKEIRIRKEVTSYNESMKMECNSYWYQLTNVPQTTSEICVPELFWETSSASLENMYAELCMTGEHFRFLKLVSERHDELKLPKYISAFMKWHNFMVEICNYHLNKTDCERPLKYVRNLVTGKDKTAEFNEQFCEFSEAWESLQVQFMNTTTLQLPCIESLNMDSKISSCIILGSDSMIYQVIELLARVQNSFLDAVLDLCVNDKCLPISFFNKHDDTATIPITSLMQITPEKLVSISRMDVGDQNSDILKDILTKFSEPSTLPGETGKIIYNFNKIEFELAHSLLLGKCYISLYQRVPRMQFADDAFQNTVSLINEVKDRIPQDSLPKMLKNQIKEKKTMSLKDMLTVSGSVLAHLKHTGGNPDRSYLEYLQTSKSITLPMSELELFHLTGDKVCLKHAVSLYRFMEELNGEVEVENLSPNFRAKLPELAKKLIDSSAKTNVQMLDNMLVAVKTFAYRRLSTETERESINKNVELSMYLKEASFWPEECKDYQGNLIDVTNEDWKLEVILYPNVMVRHVGSLAEYLSSIVLKNPQGAQKPIPSAAESPQPSGIIRMKKPKMSGF